MESTLSIKSFICPTHPSEIIQRVNIENPHSVEFLCLECLIDPKNAKPNRKLVNLSAYFSELAQTCSKAVYTPQISATDVPQPLQKFLDNQEHALKEITFHIENEKAFVAKRIDMLQSMLTNLLNTKKEQLCSLLDNQVTKVKASVQELTDYIELVFKGKINEALLFPEKFFEKANSYKTVTELNEFVKNVKRIANEVANLSKGEIDQELPKKRDNLEKSILKFEAEFLKRPTTKLNSSIAQIEEDLTAQINKLFSSTLAIQNGVNELKIYDFSPGIIETHELEMISNWILPEADVRLEPIFSAKSDGFTLTDLEKKFRKGVPTLIVAKSDKGCVFGGYFETEWQIFTKNSLAKVEENANLGAKSFLFSLSRKETYPCSVNYPKAIGPFLVSGASLVLGNDVTIPENFAAEKTISSLGAAFEVPHGEPLLKKFAYLGGAQNFTLVDLEVYEVVGVTVVQKEPIKSSKNGLLGSNTSSFKFGASTQPSSFGSGLFSFGSNSQPVNFGSNPQASSFFGSVTQQKPSSGLSFAEKLDDELMNYFGPKKK